MYLVQVSLNVYALKEIELMLIMNLTTFKCSRLLLLLIFFIVRNVVSFMLFVVLFQL